jgi:hypothetical protein
MEATIFNRLPPFADASEARAFLVAAERIYSDF